MLEGSQGKAVRRAGMLEAFQFYRQYVHVRWYRFLSRSPVYCVQLVQLSFEIMLFVYTE